MKKIKLLTTLFINVLLLLYSSASVYSEEIYPQRIISLGPSITEELYLLGVEDRLIGCTIYCKRPKEAEAKEKVATIIDVNLEKIISLNPDLVLATSLTGPKSVKKLKNLGIKVVSFSETRNFAQICQQFLELARLVGEEKKGETIVNSAKEKVNSIKRKIKYSKKPKVFVQIGTKPLFAATKQSFINDLIKFAGGINITGEIEVGHYSREEVLKSNPDVIIIVTMGIAGGKEKNTWQNFELLNAAKFDRIYIIDSDRFCSPTPISFAAALEEMVEILHQ